MSLETAFNAFVTKVQNNFTYLKNKVDSLISTVATKAAQTDLTTHTGNTTIHITAAERTSWNGKTDNTDFTTHTGDTTAHITTSERNTWNAKQSALSTQQLNNIAAVPDKLDSTTAATTYATKAELTAIADSRLKRQFVNTLPAVADAEENTLYLVPNNSSANSNVKDEYLFANGVYELMGTTEVDLSGYTTSSTFETMFTNANITVLTDGE